MCVLDVLVQKWNPKVFLGEASILVQPPFSLSFLGGRGKEFFGLFQEASKSQTAEAHSPSPVQVLSQTLAKVHLPFRTVRAVKSERGLEQT